MPDHFNEEDLEGVDDGPGVIYEFELPTHVIAASGKGQVHIGGVNFEDSGALIDVETLTAVCVEPVLEEVVRTSRPIDCPLCLAEFDPEYGGFLDRLAARFSSSPECECEFWSAPRDLGRRLHASGAPRYSGVLVTDERTHGIACDGSGEVHVVEVDVAAEGSMADIEILVPICGASETPVIRLSSRPVDCEICLRLANHSRTYKEACDCTLTVSWGEYE